MSPARCEKDKEEKILELVNTVRERSRESVPHSTYVVVVFMM